MREVETTTVDLLVVLQVSMGQHQQDVLNIAFIPVAIST